MLHSSTKYLITSFFELMHIHVFFVVEFINISEHNCNGGLARKLFNYPQIVQNSIIHVVPEFTHRYQIFHFFSHCKVNYLTVDCYLTCNQKAFDQTSPTERYTYMAGKIKMFFLGVIFSSITSCLYISFKSVFSWRNHTFQ